MYVTWSLLLFRCFHLMPCIFQPSSDVTIEWGILQLCRVAELACEHVEGIWGCLFFQIFLLIWVFRGGLVAVEVS
jgi:hypothetical protein